MTKTPEINLTQWVHDYTNDLYLWACKNVSDSETAKDLVQDTFLAAAEKLDSFKGNSSPKTWLTAILNNKIIDFYRKKSNKDITVEDNILATFFNEDGAWKNQYMEASWGNNEEHLLDNADFLTVLQNCLGALPEKWSMSVKLKYLLSKNGKEICQELGITPTNLWQMIHRAKLQLRECIDTNWFRLYEGGNR